MAKMVIQATFEDKSRHSFVMDCNVKSVGQHILDACKKRNLDTKKIVSWQRIS